MRLARAAAALKRLAASLPEGELRFDEATREAHAGDKWFASALPDAVAVPRRHRVGFPEFLLLPIAIDFPSPHAGPATDTSAAVCRFGEALFSPWTISIASRRSAPRTLSRSSTRRSHLGPAGSRGETRFVLSAGSRQSRGLQSRRQHRHQRRRASLPEVRRHRGITCWVWKSFLRTAVSCDWAVGPTRTRPDLNWPDCSWAAKACWGWSPRRPSSSFRARRGARAWPPVSPPWAWLRPTIRQIFASGFFTVRCRGGRPVHFERPRGSAPVTSAWKVVAPY
jgi:hypothetical protein